MALIQEHALLIYERIQRLVQIIKLYLQNKGRKIEISQNKGADGFMLTLSWIYSALEAMTSLASCRINQASE